MKPSAFLASALLVIALQFGMTASASAAMFPETLTETSLQGGCHIWGVNVGAGRPDAPEIGPHSFLRLAIGDSSFAELLELPEAEHAFISTEGLLPAPSKSDDYPSVPCQIVAYPRNESPSLSGTPCPPFTATVVDNGPVANFAGAARAGQTAVVRFRVTYEKFFAVGIFDISQSVGVSLDGGAVTTVAARGVEPVYVSTSFRNLQPGPHRIAFSIDGLPQGIVCI